MKSIIIRKQEQAEREVMAEEIRTEIGESAWRQTVCFNTYCSELLGLKLRFFRLPNGKAALDFVHETKDPDCP